MLMSLPLQHLSSFSMISDRCSTVQLGLQGGQVPRKVPELGVFTMATWEWGAPQNCSLECTKPYCTLGDDGAKYKTPEIEV